MKRRLLYILLACVVFISCSAPTAVRVQEPRPPRDNKMRVYIAPFKMWKGTEKQEWMGAAMSEFFLHGWRRKGIAASGPTEARHILEGEYWVKGNTLSINARLTRGMRSVGEFHWNGAADSSAIVPLWTAMVHDVNEKLKAEGYPLR